jgi:osmoprotectant transport system permease protein
VIATALPGYNFKPHFHRLTDWQWVRNHIGYIWSLSQTHLYLALISVLIGLVLAVPLGVLAVRVRWIYGPLLAITSILYTIPSVAAFAILLTVTGLSNTTVIIPLSAYALALLIRSVIDGLKNVPVEVRIAATAMGYGPYRRLLTVELPAAIPVITAGLRVTTVSSISLVTVGSLIGIGALGQLFIAGENTDFVTEIIVGIVVVAFWALIFDLLIILAGRYLTPWTRRSR